MIYKVNELQPKSIKELHDIFSTISKQETHLILKGNFSLAWYQFNDVAEALVYLPWYINEITFEVDYVYERASQDLESNSYDTPYTKKSIGNALKSYIKSLPHSIYAVNFRFQSAGFYDSSSAIADLTDILSELSLHTHIHCLNIDGFEFETRYLSFDNETEFLLNTIPYTIKELGISENPFYRPNFIRHKTIRSEIPRGLEALNLSNNDLGLLEDNIMVNFFDPIPKDFKVLNLSNNQLNKMNPITLGLFLSKIPRTVKTVKLSRNKLYEFTPDELAFILSQLPDTVSDLDIGDNHLLGYEPNEIPIFLSILHSTISSLRIIDKEYYSLLPLKLCLPPSIKRLNLSSSNLLGLSVKEFIRELANLPESVEELDLSMNNLHARPHARTDLIYLLSYLPLQIKMIKLNGNKLATLGRANLKPILATLSPNIKEVDLSQTGLDRLPYADIRAVLRYIPDTVKTLVTGSKEFTLRNDGALVPNTSPSQIGFFQPQKRFHNHRKFADLRFNMMLLVLSGPLTLELVTMIIMEALGSRDIGDYHYIKRNLSLFIISCVPFNTITNEHEKQCLAAVDKRIKDVGYGHWLDLSRCGLNRLESEEMQNRFFASLEQLPQNVFHLKLRGNGFLHDERAEEVFMELMRKIPATIQSIDLSDNGFEEKSAKRLEELFEAFPPTVEYLTLGNETPISRELQIAKRVWPKQYYEIAKGAEDRKELALKFLDDYTKGDSRLMRWLYIHPNRHHTVEAAHWVNQIKGELIAEDDLFFELERIKPDKPTGSFERRRSFMFYHPIPEIIMENEEESELKTFFELQ